MEMPKPRLARLTKLLTQLQSKRLVTARELADAHGVSIRTIYRDIRTLEESGIPIVTEEGRGYSIMEGYKLPPVMFTESEANALITAAQLVQTNSDASLAEAYLQAVTKIRAVLQYSQKEKADLLTERLHIRHIGNANSSKLLIPLQLAITNNQLVWIDYESQRQQHSNRHIEPFALYSTRGNWILVAYCRLRQAFRAFRLDRIRQLQTENEHFEPHNMTLNDYFEQHRLIFPHTPDTPLTQPGPRFAENQTFQSMKPMNIEAFDVVGIAARTGTDYAENGKQIGQLWQRFMEEGVMMRIPQKADGNIYSVYSEYEGDHNQPYTVLVGCRVPHGAEVPEGLTKATVQGGVYRQYIAQGDLTGPAIQQTWQTIQQAGLDRKFTTDFEVYGDKARNPKEGEADVFVAVGL